MKEAEKCYQRALEIDPNLSSALTRALVERRTWGTHTDLLVKVLPKLFSSQNLAGEQCKINLPRYSISCWIRTCDQWRYHPSLFPFFRVREHGSIKEERIVLLYYTLVHAVVLERKFMIMGRMFPKFSFLKTVFNDSYACL